MLGLKVGGTLSGEMTSAREFSPCSNIRDVLSEIDLMGFGFKALSRDASG